LTRTDGDRYIIYGVTDKGEIVGVYNANRRTQADIIDFIKSKKFANGISPDLEIQTLNIEGKEIDVLTIKESEDTPYYLSENYTSDGIVFANNIYSRKGDTNTPINKNSEFAVIEKLWKKRLGLHLPPIEKLNRLLDIGGSWIKDLGNKEYLYNNQYPEYKIVLGEAMNGEEPCSLFCLDPQFRYGTLEILYQNTIIYEDNYIILDGFSRYLPVPERGVIGEYQDNIWYEYYELDSMKGKLFNLFTDSTLDYSTRSGMNIQFLVFQNKNERKEFEMFAKLWFKKIELQDYDDYLPNKTTKKDKAKAFNYEHIIKAYILYVKWGNGILPVHRLFHKYKL